MHPATTPKRPEDSTTSMATESAKPAGEEGAWASSVLTCSVPLELVCCQGGVDPTGVVAVKGSYAAPPGPDWGWEIIIEPDARGGFALSMYNIPPGGEPELAVEAKYTRVTG